MSNKLKPKDLPAGHQRDEAMRKVADELAQQADESALQGGNVAALAPDEEIQYAIQHDYSDTFTPQPGWAYRWVYCGAQGRDTIHGLMQHRLDGWKTVKQGDPETAGWEECLNALGMFCVGDCVLMRIPQARKTALEERDALLAKRQQAETLAEAQHYAQEAERKLGRKIRVAETPTEAVEGTLDQLERASPQFLGHLKAKTDFESMVRTGTVPGVKLSTQTL